MTAASRRSRRSEHHARSRDVGEQWWTGATWHGIEHALPDGAVRRLRPAAERRHGVRRVTSSSVLVDESRRARRCCRRRDRRRRRRDRRAERRRHDRLAGVRIPPQEVELGPDEFNGEVDTLEGRGVLVPLAMIRDAGNVDPSAFLTTRATSSSSAASGVMATALGITGRTRVGSHRHETGLIPTTDTTPAGQIWAEVTSRRSMTNLRDHYRVRVRSAAPASCDASLQRALVVSAVEAVRDSDTDGAATPAPAADPVLARGRRSSRCVPIPSPQEIAQPGELDAAMDQPSRRSSPCPRGLVRLPAARSVVVEARRSGSGRALGGRAWNPLTKTSRWRAFPRRVAWFRRPRMTL